MGGPMGQGGMPGMEDMPQQEMMKQEMMRQEMMRQEMMKRQQMMMMMQQQGGPGGMPGGPGGMPGGPGGMPGGSSPGGPNADISPAMLAKYNQMHQKNWLAQEKSMLMQRLAMQSGNPTANSMNAAQGDDMPPPMNTVAPRGA